jgi:hypothetical protein
MHKFPPMALWNAWPQSWQFIAKAMFTVFFILEEKSKGVLEKRLNGSSVEIDESGNQIVDKRSRPSGRMHEVSVFPKTLARAVPPNRSPTSKTSPMAALIHRRKMPRLGSWR